MSGRRWIAVKFISLISLIFFVTCAKVASPPGGPEDKTGPEVLETIPAENSVGVMSGNTISIQFSESIEKKSVENAIFISPRFAGEIKYKWQKHTLNIILPDSFADSTTYIVNVGSNIADIRKNKMENTFSFAFSTGTRIDRGKISGLVVKDGKPSTGTMVALYPFEAPGDTTSFDSLYPPYITQSGKSGEYQLEFLPDGRYFIMAFTDKNKNHLFNFPREAFGLPDRIAAVSPGLSPRIDFNMIEQDTGSISIISATVTGDRLIKVRFSEKIEHTLLRDNFDKIFLQPVDSSGAGQNPTAMKERGNEPQRSFNFFFRTLPAGKYRVKIDAGVFGQAADSTPYIFSGELNIIDEDDRTPPVIDNISHTRTTLYPTDSLIELRFSEPINKKYVSDAAVRIIANDSTYADINYRWLDNFSIDLLARGLEWGKTYKIMIAETLFYDLAGNRLGDSVVNYRFDTYNHDSLGSVAGKISFGTAVDTSGTPYITFATVKGQEIISEPVIDKTFNLELPPGKYFLSGFLDRNNNGEQDYGTLFPFDYAETSSRLPDTIRVRARFETSGIEFKFE